MEILIVFSHPKNFMDEISLYDLDLRDERGKMVGPFGRNGILFPFEVIL